MLRSMWQVAAFCFLLVSCVSKPTPWSPDAVDPESRTGDQRTSGGKGDVTVAPSDLTADLPVMVDLRTDGAPDLPSEAVVRDVEVAVDLSHDLEAEDHTDAGADAATVGDVEVIDAVDTVCTPDCEGKECGTDGCGGTCGECDDNQVCGELGVCECLASFCGDLCCEPGQVCHQETGACCTPLDCPAQEQQCGASTNGCGSSLDCGECPADPNVCDGITSCVDNQCDPGVAPDCGDANECTYDQCNPSDGCFHLDKPGDCDDGDACTSGDICIGGECSPGGQVNCDDGNECTEDFCDSDLGCVNEPVVPCCGNGLVEQGEECDDPDESTFCGPECQTVAGILWKSGENSGVGKVALWCGESGRCGVVERNRWTDECEDDGGFPEGLWLRWVSPRGLALGPGIPMPDEMVSPDGVVFVEGSGGAVVGRTYPAEDVQKLLLVPLSANLASALPPKELAPTPGYTVSAVALTVEDEDLWVFWIEHDADSTPDQSRVRVQRLKLTGEQIYPAQDLMDNQADCALHGFVIVDRPGAHPCVYWRLEKKPTNVYYVKKACVDDFGLPDGAITDVLSPPDTGGLGPLTSRIPLSDGGEILLAQGSGALGDNDSASIRAVALDADGNILDKFQVNQVEEGSQSGPVGFETAPGAVRILWRSSFKNGLKLESIEVSKKGAKLTDEKTLQGPTTQMTLPALAMSPGGRGWAMWKTGGEDGVFSELWGLAVSSPCSSASPCMTSGNLEPGGCSPPTPKPEGASCAPEETCALSGTCTAAGTCSVETWWSDETECSLGVGALDAGRCAGSSCKEDPDLCPGETECTGWVYGRLDGCTPIHNCCGNGQLDGVEPCDDGPMGSAWCSTSCEPLAITVAAGSEEGPLTEGRFDDLVDGDGKWHLAWAEGPNGDALRYVAATENPSDWDVEEKDAGASVARVELADLPAIVGQKRVVDVLYRVPDNDWKFWFQSEEGTFLGGYKQSFEYIECATEVSQSACYAPQWYYSGYVAGGCDVAPNNYNRRAPRLAFSDWGQVACTTAVPSGGGHSIARVNLVESQGPACNHDADCAINSVGFSWSTDYGIPAAWLSAEDLLLATVSTHNECSSGPELCQKTVDVTQCEQGEQDGNPSCSTMEGVAMVGFRYAVQSEERFLRLPSGKLVLVFGMHRNAGFTGPGLFVVPFDGDSAGPPVLVGKVPFAHPAGWFGHLSARVWNDKYLAVAAHDKGGGVNSETIYVMRYPLEYVDKLLEP